MPGWVRSVRSRLSHLHAQRTDVPDPALCSALKTCNWNFDLGAIEPNRTVAEINCLATPAFCGFTDNGIDYVRLNLSKVQCNQSNAVACVHNNGSIAAVSSAAACTAINTCSHGGPSASSPTACASQGACVIPFTAGPATVEEELGSSGACVTPTPPYTSSGCPLGTKLSGQRRTPFGCVLLRVGSPADCVAPNVWVTAPTTQAQCEAFLGANPSHFICRRPLDATTRTVCSSHSQRLKNMNADRILVFCRGVLFHEPERD